MLLDAQGLPLLPAPFCLTAPQVSSLSHALDMSSMALSSSQRRMAELTASMEELQAQWDAELALAERHVTHLAEERDALAVGASAPPWGNPLLTRTRLLRRGSSTL